MAFILRGISFFAKDSFFAITVRLERVYEGFAPCFLRFPSVARMV
jgi:hypothetical protein